MTNAPEGAAVYPESPAKSSSEEFVHAGGLTKDVTSRYRYWRIRTMIAMIIGYASFYFVRNNLSVAVPVLKDLYGYTQTQIGAILTTFAVVYGVGKFINGYFSDRSNPRYYMKVALIGSALLNIFVGFTGNYNLFGVNLAINSVLGFFGLDPLPDLILFLSISWAINAWFQSMAWPPVAKLLTHWYSPKEIGTKWAIWNSSHQIGAFIIAIAAGYLIQIYSWQAVFYLPGMVSLGMAVLLYSLLRDTPDTLGLPPVEVYKSLVHVNDVKKEEKTTTQELLRLVFMNKVVWFVSIANMFLYTVRMGVLYWGPSFLQQMKGSSLITSVWQVAISDLFGILGGIVAGMASDKIFNGRRGPVGCIYMAALVFVLFYFWKMPAGYQLFDTIAMIGVGFLVYGPQILVGVAAADFASKKAAGMATGFTGTFGYIGSAISGIGTGLIVDTWGWEGGFLFFMASAFMGMFFFGLIWNKKSKVLEKY